MPRWVAVLLVLYAGCAFSISGPDPNRPRGQAPQCDTGKGLVVLDGLVAATAGVIAIGVASDEPALALLPAAIGAIYVGGAVSGNSKANQCQKALEEHASMTAAADVFPRPGPARYETYDPERVRDVPVAPPKRVAPKPVENLDAEDSEAPGAQEPPERPQVRQAPAAQPPAAQPQQPTRGPAKKLPPPKPQPPQPAKEDEWSDFWREVD